MTAMELQNIPADCPELKKLLEKVMTHIDDPANGLPEDVFLFLSAISPLPNVDLLIRDAAGKILLAWRNDPWWGSGWHVPGGIIRLNESFAERIQKTAQKELRTSVIHGEEPIEIREIINKDFKTRSHHISFVFDCKVPENYKIDNGLLSDHNTGFLSWHEHYPDQMLRCHEFYRKYFMI